MFDIEKFRDEIKEKLHDNGINIPFEVSYTKGSIMESKGSDGWIELKYNTSQANLLVDADKAIQDLLTEKEYEIVGKSQDAGTYTIMYCLSH